MVCALRVNCSAWFIAHKDLDFHENSRRLIAFIFYSQIFLCVQVKTFAALVCTACVNYMCRDTTQLKTSLPQTKNHTRIDVSEFHTSTVLCNDASRQD